MIPERDASGSIPRLHVVTDAGVGRGGGWAEVAEAVLEAGGEGLALHLRGPGLAGRLLHDAAVRMREVAERTGARVVVNDRVDLALAVPVWGVQLGERSLPVAEGRRLLGDGVRIGASVHGVERAREAEGEGADYLVVGTVFATPTHPERAGAGPDLVAQVRARSGLPLIAIGGISPERVGTLLDAGAHGVAVVRGVWQAPDPVAAVGGYLRALDRPATETTDSVHSGGDVSEARIRVRLNGEERQLPAGLTVEALLRSLELRPELVVVELNREILTRGRYGDAPVRDGDTLELVHFVGGGRPEGERDGV